MPEAHGWWEPPQARPADAPIRWRFMLRARWSRAEAIVSLLTLALGFGVAVSVDQHDSSNAFVGARQEDLVQILDDLDSRANRLRQEVSSLNATKQELEQGSGSTTSALTEARTRAQQLAILAGTIGAQGEGITLTITDPRGSVKADSIVDTIEELRDAGAEALEVGGVRIIASSFVTDGNGGVVVDGVQLAAPYVILAIGDPETMARAMAIPGGIVDSVDGQPGASALVVQSKKITISATHGHPVSQYAQTASPSSSASSSP